MTGVEGNASVYQVYPVSRIVGEGRAELTKNQQKKRGFGVEKEEWGGAEAQLNLSAETIKPFTGTNVTVGEGVHEFTM